MRHQHFVMSHEELSTQIINNITPYYDNPIILTQRTKLRFYLNITEKD